MTYELKPLPKDPSSYESVISKQVVEWHHDKHQAGYVAKLNEIEAKLSQFDKSLANANYSDWADAKRRESFNKAGILLHENYWRVFGSNGQLDENSEFVKKALESFGSLDAWKDDFVATAKSALGWALVVHDPYDNKLHNVLVDYHNNGAFWGSRVIVALDVFEHAYYKDYGPDRASYITKFMENLDWKEIDSIYTEK